MWIKIYSESDEDPFRDPSSKILARLNHRERANLLQDWQFENDTDDAELIRVQLEACAMMQLDSQFRTFAFSVIVFGRYARLIRWDRAGAVVTRRLDCRKQPALFAEFFWRFNHATPVHRGWDPSISPATEAEAERARAKLGIENDEPIFKYEVPDDCESFRHRLADTEDPFPATRYQYLGPRPPVRLHPLVGRATRSISVYDPRADRVVYMKDTWRVAEQCVMKEGDTYRLLHRHNVPHIIPLERANDIGGHGGTTVTQSLFDEGWVCESKQCQNLVTYTHYRIVLGIVGRDLTTFRSTYELVSGITDAVEAHKRAYEVAHILHGDISMGNILLTEDGQGLLIDWDLCIRVIDPENPTENDRPRGTWPFISAELLQGGPRTPNTRLDDLECFLYVAIVTAIHHCSSNMPAKVRQDFFKHYFGHVDHHDDDGYARGGSSKMLSISAKSFFPPDQWLGEKFKFSKSPCLLELLRDLSEGFS
ncbi:hypothetical protein BV22DRAFT_1070799 [Leucogyrophana mollusca]|uniref:Uncharacterized protein n=1 Tax=Leucogyrophana mollusca TaxID=85980 RepID=A0ACB8B9D4_9AGAM|nr:hypothetical protein BV22DRAFT_1070799 [Leucogyrophana mollusca]